MQFPFKLDPNMTQEDPKYTEKSDAGRFYCETTLVLMNSVAARLTSRLHKHEIVHNDGGN